MPCSTVTAVFVCVMMIMMTTIIITLTTRLIFRGLCSNEADHTGLRCESVAVHLLGLRVRIPPGAWVSASCECCALLGRGVSEELITSQGSHTDCGVSERDREASIMRRP